MQAREAEGRIPATGVDASRATLAGLITLALVTALVGGEPAIAQSTETDGASGTGGAGSSTSAVERIEFIECAEGSPWCKTFYFGVLFLPDYDDEDGSSNGLGEQSFFAQFNFDLLRTNNAADHAGFDLRFLVNSYA